MSKPIKKTSDYVPEREWQVILEDLRSQFRVFGEGMADMRKDLIDMRKDLTDVRHRVERIEDKVGIIEGRLGNTEGRLGNIEGRLGNIELEMAFVRKVLPTVATKDDLKHLGKRLTVLETTR